MKPTWLNHTVGQCVNKYGCAICKPKAFMLDTHKTQSQVKEEVMNTEQVIKRMEKIELELIQLRRDVRNSESVDTVVRTELIRAVNAFSFSVDHCQFSLWPWPMARIKNKG
jgi:hypothetical protein